MERDHTQEALDEYYSTGVDPTGDCINDDIVQDDLDEIEQAFYAEEPAEDGFDRLERLIDKRIAEVDDYKKQQETIIEPHKPVTTPKKTSPSTHNGEFLLIGIFIVILIIIILAL